MCISTVHVFKPRLSSLFKSVLLFITQSPLQSIMLVNVDIVPLAWWLHVQQQSPVCLTPICLTPICLTQIPLLQLVQTPQLQTLPPLAPLRQLWRQHLMAICVGVLDTDPYWMHAR